MPVKYRKHEIYPDVFPETWASGWGEDEFGIWMEFTYRGVTQRFRWCEHVLTTQTLVYRLAQDIHIRIEV